MARIVLGPLPSPGSLSAARLPMGGADLGGPAQALQQTGQEIQRLGVNYAQNQQDMAKYNNNMNLERWQTDQAIQAQTDWQTAKPDGSDYLARRDASLLKSYQQIRKGITDPAELARADSVFEKTRGSQIVSGMGDVQKRQSDYVVGTTSEDAQKAYNAGQFPDKASFDAYFGEGGGLQQRINSVTPDKLDQMRIYEAIAKPLADQYLHDHPEMAMPVASTGKGSGGSLAQSKIDMTPQERNTLGLILKYESGGKNVMNYAGTAQGLDPQTPKGSTAQGYYQILNSNWQRIAPTLGIQAPNAMAASFEDQTRVALQLMRQSGVGNWTNFNPSLNRAMHKGEMAGAFEAPASVSYTTPPKPTGGAWDFVTPDKWDTYVRQGQVKIAADVQQTVDDSLAATKLTGGYNGPMPGPEAFAAAFGEEGAAKYDKYQHEMAVSHQIYNMQTMPAWQIGDMVRQAEIAAQSGGPGSAQAAADYADIKTAGEADIKTQTDAAALVTKTRNEEAAITKDAATATADLRKKDPVEYTIKSNPYVAEAWAHADMRDPESMRDAIAATLIAQRQLGFAPSDMQPLPTELAQQAATYIKDGTQDAEPRLKTFEAIMTATDDPQQRIAMFNQLVKGGIDPRNRSVLNALEREDFGAAQTLFTAANGPPADKLPKGVMDDQFGVNVETEMTGQGKPGEYLYGGANGQTFYSEDRSLVETVARIYMGGEKHMKQADAIARAVKDLYGDTVPITGSLPNSQGNVAGTLPRDSHGQTYVQTDALKQGMGRAAGQVEDVLNYHAKQNLDRLPPDASFANKAIVGGTQNYAIKDIIANGAFRQIAHEKWGYFDPYTNTFVSGYDGKSTLTFTTEQLVTMSEGPRGPQGRASGGPATAASIERAGGPGHPSPTEAGQALTAAAQAKVVTESTSTTGPGGPMGRGGPGPRQAPPVPSPAEAKGVQTLQDISPPDVNAGLSAEPVPAPGDHHPMLITEKLIDAVMISRSIKTREEAIKFLRTNMGYELAPGVKP